VLVFVEGGKPENKEKNRSKARTNNKLNPHMELYFTLIYFTEEK